MCLICPGQGGLDPEAQVLACAPGTGGPGSSFQQTQGSQMVMAGDREIATKGTYSRDLPSGLQLEGPWSPPPCPSRFPNKQHLLLTCSACSLVRGPLLLTAGLQPLQAEGSCPWTFSDQPQTPQWGGSSYRKVWDSSAFPLHHCAPCLEQILFRSQL